MNKRIIERLSKELKELQQKALRYQKLAFTDSLTGICNSACLNIIKFPAKCSIIYIDADDFKSINEVYGYSAGDEALRHIADSIVENIRHIDLRLDDDDKIIPREHDIPIRTGGDEFIIVLPGVTETSDITNIISRIKKSVSKEFKTITLNNETKNISVSVSAGYAVRKNSENMLKVIHKAENKLKRAKKVNSPKIKTLPLTLDLVA